MSLAADAGNTNLTFSWSSSFPKLSEITSNCSILISTGDAYEQNFATSAGGALFSSAMNTTLVDCSQPSGQQAVPALAEVNLTCTNPTWSNNAVSADPSQPGYGPAQAFPPATLSVDPSSFTNYVSNGISSLPMVVRVLDQAHQFITTGKAWSVCDRYAPHARLCSFALSSCAPGLYSANIPLRKRSCLMLRFSNVHVQAHFR